MGNVSINQRSFNRVVGEGCTNPIQIIFDTLILQRNEQTYEWYQRLAFDKSFGSRVRRGLLIPHLKHRVKIANYFGVDSSAIWRVKDLDFIKLILKEQNKNDTNTKTITKT